MKSVLFAAVALMALVTSPAMAYEPGALAISDSESNRIGGADIQLTRDWKVVAQAAPFHKVEAAVMEIRESDNCDYRKVSESQIQVGGHCEFLSGAYRYMFTPEGGSVRHQVIVGFTVSRPSVESRIFMVSPALEILDK